MRGVASDSGREMGLASWSDYWSMYNAPLEEVLIYWCRVSLNAAKYAEKVKRRG